MSKEEDKKTEETKEEAKKTSAKKTAAKKTASKKTAAKKAPAKKKMTTKKVAAAKKTPAKKTAAKKKAVKKAATKKAAPKTQDKKPSTKEPLVQKTAKNIEEKANDVRTTKLMSLDKPEVEKVRLEDLKGNMCRWPYGDPRKKDTFYFCGVRHHEDGSYCAEHTAMSHRSYNAVPEGQEGEAEKDQKAA